MERSSSLKSEKAPGPDSISMDWIKVSPLQFKHLLLAHYNSCFFAADAPDSWKLARVAMIYKGKGKDPRSPSSYRPISLANSFYKLYATMLQHRIASSIDYILSPHQFGFRKSRSTSTPVFLIRRLLSNILNVILHLSTFYSWTGSRLSTRSPAKRCRQLLLGMASQRR